MLYTDVYNLRSPSFIEGVFRLDCKINQYYFLVNQVSKAIAKPRSTVSIGFVVSELNGKADDRVEMATTIRSLPSEVTKMVAAELDKEDHTSRHRLAHVCHNIYWKLQARPGALPRMNKADWYSFNNKFEKDARRRPLNLACSVCSGLLPPTSYSDSQARKTCYGKRFCVACGIRSRKYRRRSFKIGRIDHFACLGCKNALHVGLEDPRPEWTVWHNRKRYGSSLGLEGPNSSAGVIAAATAIPRGCWDHGSRWCRPCWTQRKQNRRYQG